MRMPIEQFWIQFEHTHTVNLPFFYVLWDIINTNLGWRDQVHSNLSSHQDIQRNCMLVIVLTQIIPSLLFLELLLPYVRLIPHLRSSPIKNRTWYNWGTNNVVCWTRNLVTYLDHRMILLPQKRRGASNFHLRYM